MLSNKSWLYGSEASVLTTDVMLSMVMMMNRTTATNERPRCIYEAQLANMLASNPKCHHKYIQFNDEPLGSVGALDTPWIIQQNYGFRRLFAITSKLATQSTTVDP
ncbi:hypothetical protein CRM22_011188 [Opisthorchis felineus]|uniref:Uncharacterized protein n=1 Tax=Opisthorchis felineus TaxID=147828 RepID=A0A4S2KAS5_OPIFE|nr:hypothetical protein CRM22_011188 [Opisthorchis felineus]